MLFSLNISFAYNTNKWMISLASPEMNWHTFSFFRQWKYFSSWCWQLFQWQYTVNFIIHTIIFSFSDVFFHFHLNIATQTFSWYFSDPHVNWLRNDFIFEKTRFNVVGRNDNIFLAQDDAVLQLLLNALSIRMGRKARAHALGTIKDHLWCSKLIIPDSPCNYVQIYWNCTTL